MEHTQDEREGLFQNHGDGGGVGYAPAHEQVARRLIAACWEGTFLKATPTLADQASQYKSCKGPTRPAADPIGLAGLPDTRKDLNALLMDLCRRLVTAGGPIVRGDRLVAAMSLDNSRALRLLVAYGRVHHHIRPIVGIYGQGYCWADLADNPAEVYALARGQAIETAKCHLFLSTLFSRADDAMGLVQLVFPFAKIDAPGSDDLAALLAAKGIDREQVLEAMIAHCRAAGDEGIAAIRRVAARHQDVMIPGDRLAAIRQNLQSALNYLPPAPKRPPTHGAGGINIPVRAPANAPLTAR